MKKQNIIDNIVRVGNCEDTELYEHAILIRMHPKIYRDYGCIKIQTTGGRLEYADVIIKRFEWAGLVEKDRKKVTLKAFNKDGGSYILPDAYEIILEKIPALQLKDQESQYE